VGLDHPGDLPGVAGHLERHSVVAAEASGEQLGHLRGGADPGGGADLTVLGDRDLAEVTVDV
jgi:hypothetical protein